MVQADEPSGREARAGEGTLAPATVEDTPGKASSPAGGTSAQDDLGGPTPTFASGMAGPESFPPPEGGWPLGWERYQYLGLLGSGGMGQVFEAWDPTLRRRVAIKLLRGEDPDLVRRFLREAQAQARVDHPNVCKVYEVGEVDGRPFIAMQLVAGKPLSRLWSEVTVEQKALLLKQVAEALHAAHKLGLVHRDLKPGNIMVEGGEDGSLRPYVVDFGLVRELGAESLTLDGAAVGTPSFMAPEQAAGETARIDRRTDVYSLGATLYSVLGGQPPFGGSSPVEVLRKVIDEEPSSLVLAAPGVPADLVTIVMKCLEKDPARRYESARALAEDLGRFLDGDPIEARPASMIYRLGKRVRKNRLAFGMGAAAVLATLILGGMWLAERRAAARRAELAQRFGEQARDMEWLLRAEYLSPPHDVRPVRQRLRERIGALEEAIRTVGRPATGPGNLAIGRALFALAEPAAAREHLERAWESGYQTPEVAYFLGASMGMLYQRELQRVRGLTGTRARQEQIERAEADLRDPALRMLRIGAGAEGVSPAFVQGLIALHEQRFEDGFARAREVAGGPSWSYDGEMLAGALFLEAGMHASVTRRDLPTRRAMLLDARKQFQAACAKGRSDPAPQIGLCRTNLYLLSGRIFLQMESLEQAEIDDTLASCDAALALDADSLDAMVSRAGIHVVIGGARQQTGDDPTPYLDTAVSDCDRVLARDPAHLTALSFRGYARKQLGYYRAPTDRRGLDDLRAALADYRRGLSLRHDDPGILTNMGDCYVALAGYAPAHGEDVFPVFEEGMTLLEQALAAAPKHRGLAMTLGSLALMKSRYEAEHGVDPIPSATRAVAFYQQGAEGASGPEELRNLALALVDLAQLTLEVGQDPSELVSRALAAVDEAHRINPRYNLPLRVRALARFVRAEHAARTGADPRPWLERAHTDLAAALELPPSDPEIWLEQAAFFLLQASSDLEGGRPLLRALRDAEGCLRRYRAEGGVSTLLLKMEGELELARGRATAAAGADPDPHFHTAVEKLAESAGRADARAGELTALAQAHLHRARWLCGKIREVAADIAAGLAAAEAAIALNGRHAEAHATRAALLVCCPQRGHTRQQREQAAAALAQALELNPLLARSYADVGEELQKR